MQELISARGGVVGKDVLVTLHSCSLKNTLCVKDLGGNNHSCLFLTEGLGEPRERGDLLGAYIADLSLAITQTTSLLQVGLGIGFRDPELSSIRSLGNLRTPFSALGQTESHYPISVMMSALRHPDGLGKVWHLWSTARYCRTSWEWRRKATSDSTLGDSTLGPVSDMPGGTVGSI